MALSNVTSHPLLWIHCNVCYELYIKKERRFFLLACNHVLCIGCVQEISDRKVNGPKVYNCRICKDKTRACEMNNNMPAHLKELFHVEPYQEGINTMTVLKFQNIHIRRFIKFLFKGVIIVLLNDYMAYTLFLILGTTKKGSCQNTVGN